MRQSKFLAAVCGLFLTLALCFNCASLSQNLKNSISKMTNPEEEQYSEALKANSVEALQEFLKNAKEEYRIRNAKQYITYLLINKALSTFKIEDFQEILKTGYYINNQLENPITACIELLSELKEVKETKDLDDFEHFKKKIQTTNIPDLQFQPYDAYQRGYRPIEVKGYEIKNVLLNITSKAYELEMSKLDGNSELAKARKEVIEKKELAKKQAVEKEITDKENKEKESLEKDYSILVSARKKLASYLQGRELPKKYFDFKIRVEQINDGSLASHEQEVIKIMNTIKLFDFVAIYTNTDYFKDFTLKADNSFVYLYIQRIDWEAELIFKPRENNTLAILKVNTYNAGGTVQTDTSNQFQSEYSITRTLMNTGRAILFKEKNDFVASF